MNKFLEFGRKALFYVRVLSGYEERRIRSYRLKLEERALQAQARKEAINKVPEQFILSEVRRMVEEMQTLNKKLEETEAAIDDYFKPLNKEAQILMEMQLKGEEQNAEMMMTALQQQAMRQKFEAEIDASKHQAENLETNKETGTSMIIGEDEMHQADPNPASTHQLDPKEAVR